MGYPLADGVEVVGLAELAANLGGDGQRRPTGTTSSHLLI